MNWLKRMLPKEPAATEAAKERQCAAIPALSRQFNDFGVGDADRIARRAAAAGLTADHIKTTATARYAIFRAPDADRAKGFLLDDLTVDRKLVYFIVETPDGNWGKDLEGLFLEKLLPWQRDIGPAEYEARIVAVPISTPSSAFVAASKGRADNYVAVLSCGRCGARWRDGIQYYDFTAVRCPACRALNSVDSRSFTVSLYAVPGKPPESNVPGIRPSPIGSDELTDPHRIGRRLVGLVEEHSNRESTRAQRRLCLDTDHLDKVLAGDEPLEPWVRPCTDVRAIGYQLDRTGGKTLMDRVFYTLTPEDDRFAVMVVSTLWDRIGEWEG